MGFCFKLGIPLNLRPFHGPDRKTLFSPTLIYICGYPPGSSIVVELPNEGSLVVFHDTKYRSRPVIRNARRKASNVVAAFRRFNNLLRGHHGTSKALKCFHSGP
ncbi:hypothetical protein SADUNF_Sadunf11G0092500 [Salix dunnii]|uniref:Uncharacterized protein n=1 Tax=Salix dunnii TaxID=1413687 RepID=A0A835JL00_9ROSI|nr:hypothetical protein SADUNF_Sadunf11G0092500 [Salix dunnii]